MQLKCKQQHFIRKLCDSERDLCNWVISRSGHVHTLNENRTRVCLVAGQDHLFSWVSVRLFGPHPSAIAVPRG